MGQFKKGMFDDAGKAGFGGGIRYPFANQLPVGEYVFEVTDCEAFESYKSKQLTFKATMKILEGPTEELVLRDGSTTLLVSNAPTVTLMTDRGSEFFYAEIKGFLRACMQDEIAILDEDGEQVLDEDGEPRFRSLVAEDIDGKMIEEAISPDIVFPRGSIIAATVFHKTTKAGKDIHVVQYSALDDEQANKYLVDED